MKSVNELIWEEVAYSFLDNVGDKIVKRWLGDTIFFDKDVRLWQLREVVEERIKVYTE